jgi:hypothetical protein
MPLVLELAGGRLRYKRDIERWQVMHYYTTVHIVLFAFAQLLTIVNCACMHTSSICYGVLQAVYDLLCDGAFDGDARIRNLIQSSLQQLGNDTVDAALYESMLIDIATVFYGRNARAAVCAWSAIDKHAAARLEQLLDCSLVKIINEGSLHSHYSPKYEVLWVHDVIKSIARKKARTAHKQNMTRVWLPDQVTVVESMIQIQLQCFAAR